MQLAVGRRFLEQQPLESVRGRATHHHAGARRANEEVAALV